MYNSSVQHCNVVSHLALILIQKNLPEKFFDLKDKHKPEESTETFFNLLSKDPNDYSSLFEEYRKIESFLNNLKARTFSIKHEDVLLGSMDIYEVIKILEQMQHEKLIEALHWASILLPVMLLNCIKVNKFPPTC